MAGPDRRERQNSFLEPLELEELDSRPQTDEDPDVFDRVTAVPGELPLTPPRPEDTAVDEGISGLFERAEAEAEPASRRERRSEPPATSSEPASSGKRPSRQPPRPDVATPRPPPSARRRPAIELELDLGEPEEPEPEPERGRDSLEIELPVGHPETLPSPGPNEDPEVVAMKDRYATGDFSGALIVAEGILETHPGHAEARRCQARCTDVLSQMYLARLGSLQQVVRVAVSPDQIRWLSLDHRAGFLLSLVDGASSIETLLDISGMPRLEALRILFGLLDQRVIALSEGR